MCSMELMVPYRANSFAFKSTMVASNKSFFLTAGQSECAKKSLNKKEISSSSWTKLHCPGNLVSPVKKVFEIYLPSKCKEIT